MAERDIIAENQTAAAISKLRRGEADNALRDEAQAATLTTLQRVLADLADIKSSMWTRQDLKNLIDEEQTRHCDHCPTKKWVEGEMARLKMLADENARKDKPRGTNWFSELIRSESLRYFILILLLVFALIYIKGGLECVEAAKDGVTHMATGGLK